MRELNVNEVQQISGGCDACKNQVSPHPGQLLLNSAILGAIPGTILFLATDKLYMIPLVSMLAAGFVGTLMIGNYLSTNTTAMLAPTATNVTTPVAIEVTPLVN